MLQAPRNDQNGGRFHRKRCLRARSQPLCLRSRPFRPSRLASQAKSQNLTLFQTSFKLHFRR
ncbi:MAG: hypothetical protein ACTS5A_02330 [Candidatus Hodgkinia cicadicola]